MSSPSSPPTDKLGSLQASLNLLHLLFHRNKNQHRRSQWWKHMSLLRRNLAHLLTELPDEDQAARAAAREQHLAANIIPKCYPAFRTLATEGRFCATGLVLLGVLADIIPWIEPTSLESGEGRQIKSENRIAAAEAHAAESDMPPTEDLGVRIERDELDEQRGGEMPSRSAMATVMQVDDIESSILPAIEMDVMAKKKTSSIGTKQTKHSSVKKKRKNAIDNLFSGLS